MLAIFSHFAGFAYFHLAGVSGKNRDQFSLFDVQLFRQDMRVSDDVETIGDNKSGAAENRGWPAGFLKCADRDHSRLHFLNRIRQRVTVGRMTHARQN